MDLVIHAPGVSGPILVHVTMVNALTRDALNKNSATRDGATAANAARVKRNKYANLAVVIEDHGRINEDGARLVRKLAPAGTDRSIRLAALYQQLASSIQKASARSLIAATARIT